MPEGENTITDLKRYLGTEGNLVTMQEFKEFWDSCTEEEKMEFKSTKLE